MAKQWSGDGQYHLPEAKVEPYRLWFEFLKLAYRDPAIKVDERFYRSWGDVENSDFDEWWADHWRDLFAIDNQVRITSIGEAIPKKDDAIYVRLPLARGIDETLKDVKALLVENSKSNKSAKKVTGKFALSDTATAGFVKQMRAARCMLRYYEIWLRHANKDSKRRTNASAKDYFNWADNWNRRVREKGWNRPLVYLPSSFRTYTEWLASSGTSSQASYGIGGGAENARRMVVRYRNKAIKIAENVAGGEFPGVY